MCGGQAGMLRAGIAPVLQLLITRALYNIPKSSSARVKLFPKIGVFIQGREWA